MGGKEQTKAPEEPVADPEGTPYHTNETVLAHTFSLIYEAKVLKVQQTKDGHFQFFLHYNGWSKNWDEWVETDRVMKLNDENKAKAKQLKADLKASKSSNKKKSKKTLQEEDANPKSSKKAKVEAPVVDETVEDDSEWAKKQLSLRIPGPIKKLLIGDWENITQHKKILKLPRKHTLNGLLQEFLTHKTRTPENMEIMTEVVGGIKTYFERALPVILLYRFERPQYEELVEKRKAEQQDVELCNTYGAEHLARLFVKLPGLLAHTQMGTAELNLLQNKIVEIIRWLARHPEYFNKNYITTDRAYHEKLDKVAP